MEDTRKALGLRLAQLRLARDLSQAGLARTVGTSHATISRLERGEGPLDERLLGAVGAALGLTPRQLDYELEDCRVRAKYGARVARLLARNPTLVTLLAHLDPELEYGQEACRPLVTAVVRVAAAAHLAETRAGGSAGPYWGAWHRGWRPPGQGEEGGSA